jgi:hypothetical protein
VNFEKLILSLDDRPMQKVLREMDNNALACAIRDESPAVHTKIYRNVSVRVANMLQEDIKAFTPGLSPSEEQERIISIIRHLADTGEIILDSTIQNELGIESHPLGQFYNFKNIEEFENYLLKSRNQKLYETYGAFEENISVLKFFSDPNAENFLADIKLKNEKEKMGNVKIPGTNIVLYNYSICPKCQEIFSFKQVIDYYNNPKPDPRFKDRQQQFRQDTRVHCPDCGTYFLPSLVISDGTPRNECQFLCRIQTAHAIEDFYEVHFHKPVMSRKKENIIVKKYKKAVHADILLEELQEKPTLISNLIQYTPINLIPNLLDGTNKEKGDVLYGAWFPSSNYW